MSAVELDSPGSGHDARHAVAHFDPDAASVRAARRFVAEVAELAGTRAADVELVTSELATNAVLHAGTPFRVEVDRDARRLRVAVCDDDPNPPIVQDHGIEAPTGRGLRILAAIADRWGVDASGPGKAVWFELDLDGARHPEPS